MTWTTAYQKRSAKASQRRRRIAQERLTRDRLQAQYAAAALQQPLKALGLPEDLVAETAGRLRSQQQLLGKIVRVMFPPLFGCRTNTELCRVRGWDKNLPSRILGALPKRSWIKRLRRLGLEVLVPRRACLRRPSPTGSRRVSRLFSVRRTSRRSVISAGAWSCCRLLWHLGYPDQALQRSHEAQALARQLAHPFSRAFALYYSALFYQLRREGQSSQELSEALIALSHEQGFEYRMAGGTILRGWALTVQGRGEEGVAQMCQGLATYERTGATLVRPYWLALLAEVSGQAGQAEEGLSLLAEALALVEKHRERWWEAELHRLQGELLLLQAAGRGGEAEVCFRQALDVACRQQAKSLELRAAVSLARLWQHQGKRAEARQLLAPIYGWFTEGFDTADLQDAKALLEALA